MKNYWIFGCLALTAFFIACANKEENGLRNIEDYYYPLSDLQDGKVYEYEPLGEEGDPPVYWYYRSVLEGGSGYLVGMSYDPAFNPDQFVREERVWNGMLLKDFIIYETDAEGKSQQIRAGIEAANVFPFEVKPLGGVLLSSLHWRPLGDSSSITLVRNRQFDSDTTVVFQGKNVDAVKFNTRELVDQEEEGHLELEFGGTEVYAKKIGLVYFRKNVSGQRRIEYRLKSVYSMAEFEQKFKEKLELGELEK
ncbi:MAG: hypothetical protein K9J37_21595 [Saprospiraceae bacterium]|nr:hypothetical protein [Saprospiraceae bacterium]MCF8252516.1 hypothetical protein [Saprospiraceae bacterium]MCF8282540.1 hypothetical protein [Bacteroidales bacterium]MCF8314125.1 hypothetical protein [Saprospiraceae bacterium]MCF8442870.1 hypothetical protein [Saprospiraceae bacterium]